MERFTNFLKKVITRKPHSAKKFSTKANFAIFAGSIEYSYNIIKYCITSSRHKVFGKDITSLLLPFPFFQHLLHLVVNEEQDLCLVKRFASSASCSPVAG